MATFVAVTLFALLMGSISIYGYRRYARPARYFDQIGEAVITPEESLSSLSNAGTPGMIVRVIQQVGQQIPISPDDATMTRSELIAAGFRESSALSVFYGCKVLFAFVFLVLGLMARDYITSNGVLRIVLVIAAVFLGYFLPNYFLEKLVDARRERIRFGLPDALDLLVVSVEAGLGLDQAILHVSREIELTHKELSDELTLVNLEMRAGKRRSDALRHLADRTGERELRKLVAVLIQTDRFGTSLADSLRGHSDFMRVRRRQEAEERAGKVGVKLVFPIFFFILPSMLVVAAGPGLLQVFKYLFPMMRQFHM